MVRFGVIRIRRDDLLVLLFRAGEIPIEPKLNVCLSSARFGKITVDA